MWDSTRQLSLICLLIDEDKLLGGVEVRKQPPSGLISRLYQQKASDLTIKLVGFWVNTQSEIWGLIYYTQVIISHLLCST